MDMLSAIKFRRSIRKYKKDILSDEFISKALESARWAPSGLNNQPWRFIVVKDASKKEEIAKFTKYSKQVINAPALFIVCMDLSSSYNREKDLMAIGGAIQNMLLELSSLGLGACWIGEITNKKKELGEYLGLNDDTEILALVTAGFPDEEPAGGSRKSIKDLVIKI